MSSWSSKISSGDSQEYGSDQPFEEARPTSSIWQAYVDENMIYNRDICDTHRGEMSILLVFVSDSINRDAISLHFFHPVGRTILSGHQHIHCTILSQPSAKLSVTVSTFSF